MRGAVSGVGIITIFAGLRELTSAFLSRLPSDTGQTGGEAGRP